MTISEWEPEGYDASIIDPLDISIPGYITIDPVTGKIGAAFTGKVTAIGLTLPIGSVSSPPDTNRVRWVDDITNPSSPERTYIFGTSFRGVEATDYLLQSSVVTALGADIITSVLRMLGSSRFPATPGGEVYFTPFGNLSNARTLYLCPGGAGFGGLFTMAPIVERLALQGNVLANPATAIGSGNDYGLILMSQFPPTGGNTPQHGDRVRVQVDGTNYVWTFEYSSSAGAWLCTGGVPIVFASSSPTTLAPASTWVAMGFNWPAPRTGTYVIGGVLSGAGSTAGASTQEVSPAVNGVPTGGITPEFSTPSASYGWGLPIPTMPVGAAAGALLDLMAWTNGTNATVSQKNMTIIPQEIS